MPTLANLNQGRHYIIVERYKHDEPYAVINDPHEYDFQTPKIWTLKEAKERLANCDNSDGCSYYIINISPECKVE